MNLQSIWEEILGFFTSILESILGFFEGLFD